MGVMSKADIGQQIGPAGVGDSMYYLIRKLYPVCRSITGNGVRETLRQVGEHIPLKIREVPTGTKVFDWTVPREWNIRDAYVKNSDGQKVIDFGRSNLHVLNYSIPVRKKLSLAELREHLFTLPDQPGWIPYKTSYYQERWGFCLTHDQLDSLSEGT
jgi:aminopeptidase-like protein